MCVCVYVCKYVYAYVCNNVCMCIFIYTSQDVFAIQPTVDSYTP